MANAKKINVNGKPSDSTEPTPCTGTDLVDDGLAKIAEASKFLAIGRTKIYDLMDSGQLAYVRLGRCRRIPWRAVRELAAAGLVGLTE